MSQERECKPTESPRSRLVLLLFVLLLVFGILAYAVVVTNAERIMSVLLQENDEIERPFCIHDYGLQIEVDGKQLRGVASFLSCLDYGVVTGSQGAKGAHDTAMETRFVVLLKHHLLEESHGP